MVIAIRLLVQAEKSSQVRESRNARTYKKGCMASKIEAKPFVVLAGSCGETLVDTVRFDLI